MATARTFRTPRAPRAFRTAVALGGAAALTLVAGCAPQGSSSVSAQRTVSYWLWDANQLPAYQACARDFEKKNPGLTVKITQVGWDDYWTKLTAAFIADTAPDVFTDHVSKFAQFADLGVLAPLDELPATKGIKNADYQPGLGASWIGQDGHRYGAPKDWDTVALFYNKKMAKAAGVSAKDLNSLAWNPRDGGTFEKTIAHLTVDRNGVRGDEPGFDKNHVRTYGLATNDAGHADGQTQWSAFTGSAGWSYTNKRQWGDHYNYDQPAFKKAISWYFGLAKKGYLAPFTDFSESNGPEVQLGSGKAAIAMHGSWMISTFAGLKGVDVGAALTPVGPSGHRATMMNGLADSISKHAKNKKGAQKWVAYLASNACQKTVGKHGIVFPATRAGTAAAAAAYQKDGIDTTAFTKPVADRTTFPFPVTDYAADIDALMTPAMQDVYANGASASDVLDRTNQQVNFLFDQ
ncbi:sugar ABC transporter substrate-binding protein [Streptomyces sp. Rer75]|uniref:ABC transporter substrate-binding protein n=1 Tax=Streptomyces sp. Rer75 TaxID=2750011 RepID=UPI0015CFACDF|nr:sugar ABC transporter substrate-binding protein [Streptomyces sp. Rer75]QLH20487.1 sugar ABC transporter substrate-binding protein [Streptomyces sp. Rer75]